MYRFVFVFTKATKDYEVILSGVQGNHTARLMTSKFLRTLCHHFPRFAQPTLDAMLSLCEDLDEDVRLNGIKQLPYIAEALQEVHVVADVLSQLLHTPSSHQRGLVQACLREVVKASPICALTAVFHQLRYADTETRFYCLQFITGYLEDEGLGEGGEFMIAKEIALCLQTDCSTAEVESLIHLLHSHVARTATGRIKLVQVAEKLADFKNLLNPENLSPETWKRGKRRLELANTVLGVIADAEATAAAAKTFPTDVYQVRLIFMASRQKLKCCVLAFQKYLSQIAADAKEYASLVEASSGSSLDKMEAYVEEAKCVIITMEKNIAKLLAQAKA